MTKNYIAITVDYETWHPTVDGYEERWKKNGIRIDFEKDIIQGANNLMEVADELDIKLTFMAEMGEYFWLKQNEPSMAEKIAKQLEDAISRGHDVQLHIHFHWIPETGACRQGDSWKWNCDYACAENYPFDLDELVRRCKSELERKLQRVKPSYRVTSFRAGTYLVQPFTRLYHALSSNGIYCDSSVYMGGVSKERGYDFRRCKFRCTPYWVDEHDPAKDRLQSDMFELPIYTYRKGKAWRFDNGRLFGDELITSIKRTSYDQDNYFVMIGHTKEQQDLDVFRQQIDVIKELQNIEWVTLSDMALIAQNSLMSKSVPGNPANADMNISKAILVKAYERIIKK